MTLRELDLPPWLAGLFAVVWGCLWASFLNVVIYRVPRGMSVVRPGSHCPGCGKPIRPLDNVPVLSWLLLRGRARCCGTRVSPRYVAVEVLGGVIALAIAEVVIRPLPADTSLVHAASIFLADLALALALVAAAFIDLSHMYLPDAITLGGTLFGLATPGLRDLTWVDALIGAAGGFVGVWLPFIVAYQALRGRPGMGLGDAKLVMLAGAWFGWPGAAFALFGGALQATVGAAVVLLVRGRIEEPEAVRADREELQRAAAQGDAEAIQALEDDPLANPPDEGIMAARMPFGPFLCLAIIEWMLGGDWLRALLPLGLTEPLGPPAGESRRDAGRFRDLRHPLGRVSARLLAPGVGRSEVMVPKPQTLRLRVSAASPSAEALRLGFSASRGGCSRTPRAPCRSGGAARSWSRCPRSFPSSGRSSREGDRGRRGP